jgi:hypothetical protein
MPSKPKTNAATRALSFTKILAGITQHVTAAILLGGASMTQQALTAIFQAALQAQADLDAARATVRAKVQAQKAALATAAASEVLLRRWAGRDLRSGEPGAPRLRVRAGQGSRQAGGRPGQLGGEGCGDAQGEEGGPRGRRPAERGACHDAGGGRDACGRGTVTREVLVAGGGGE